MGLDCGLDVEIHNATKRQLHQLKKISKNDVMWEICNSNLEENEPPSISLFYWRNCWDLSWEVGDELETYKDRSEEFDFSIDGFGHMRFKGSETSAPIIKNMLDFIPKNFYNKKWWEGHDRYSWNWKGYKKYLFSQLKIAKKVYKYLTRQKIDFDLYFYRG